jgi:hypothetical protein
VNVDDLPSVPAADGGVRASRSSTQVRAASKKPAKPAVNCNPPWTLDKDGIRRLKPECL